MKKAFLLTLLCEALSINTTPLVYNMRIRRVFKVSNYIHVEPRSLCSATLLPIFYARTRHIVDPRLSIDVYEKTKMGGSLLNFHYKNKHDWWLDVTTGLEYEHSRFHGSSHVNAARTGFDDLVFAAGMNLFPIEGSQLVFYRLREFHSHAH